LIFREAAQMQLPVIERADFIEYLDFQFQETGKPADDEALNYLLSATGRSPAKHAATRLGVLDKHSHDRAGDARHSH
jgi:DNA polymerase III delta subunit